MQISIMKIDTSRQYYYDGLWQVSVKQQGINLQLSGNQQLSK